MRKPYFGIPHPKLSGRHSADGEQWESMSAVRPEGDLFLDPVPQRIRLNLPEIPVSFDLQNYPIPSEITALDVATLAARIKASFLDVPRSCELAIDLIRQSAALLDHQRQVDQKFNKIPESTRVVIAFWKSVGDEIARRKDEVLFCESIFGEEEQKLKELTFPFPLSKDEVHLLSRSSRSSYHQHFKEFRHSQVAKGLSAADCLFSDYESFDQEIEVQGINRRMFEQLVEQWPKLRAVLDESWERFKKRQKNI